MVHEGCNRMLQHAWFVETQQLILFVFTFKPFELTYLIPHRAVHQHCCLHSCGFLSLEIKLICFVLPLELCNFSLIQRRLFLPACLSLSHTLCHFASISLCPPTTTPFPPWLFFPLLCLLCILFLFPPSVFLSAAVSSSSARYLPALSCCLCRSQVVGM